MPIVYVTRSWQGDTYYLPTEEIPNMCFPNDEACKQFIKSKYNVEVEVVTKG